jgi:hypothetical protein
MFMMMNCSLHSARRGYSVRFFSNPEGSMNDKQTMQNKKATCADKSSAQCMSSSGGGVLFLCLLLERTFASPQFVAGVGLSGNSIIERKESDHLRKPGKAIPSVVRNRFVAGLFGHVFNLVPGPTLTRLPCDCCGPSFYQY